MSRRRFNAMKYLAVLFSVLAVQVSVVRAVFVSVERNQAGRRILRVALSQCLTKSFSSFSHLQPSQGLRGRFAGESCECLLLQVDAFFAAGVPIAGNSMFEENDGWRCMDTTGAPIVYSLEDLPAGFIENLRDEDSGNALLSISSATKSKGIGQSNRLADASASSSNNGKNAIKVNNGATVTISRGNNNENLNLQEGRRLAAAPPGTPNGDHTLLVVRVSGIDAIPSRTATTISGDVFGTDGDPLNLVSESDSMTIALALFQ